jgi:hypothetical protein
MLYIFFRFGTGVRYGTPPTSRRRAEPPSPARRIRESKKVMILLSSIINRNSMQSKQTGASEAKRSLGKIWAVDDGNLHMLEVGFCADLENYANQELDTIPARFKPSATSSSGGQWSGTSWTV